MSSPDELALDLAKFARPCTSGEIATTLLDLLRKAQCIGSPDNPEPLHLFVTAGGVAALARALKANTPVAADWDEGAAPVVDLSDVLKEASGVLNNLAAAALAGDDDIVSALQEAAVVPVLVATVDAYATRPDVLHRVLPALAQLTSLVADQVAASDDAIRVIVRSMETSEDSDAWVHCSAARVLNLMLQRGDAAKRVLLHAGALGATMRALNASADEAKLPKGYGFSSEQLRQKLVAMGAPLVRDLSALADETYAPGVKGMLEGLTARADLNEAEATVQRPTGAAEADLLKRKGRVKVQAKGECLAVRYTNLMLLGPCSPAPMS